MATSDVATSAGQPARVLLAREAFARPVPTCLRAGVASHPPVQASPLRCLEPEPGQCSMAASRARSQPRRLGTSGECRYDRRVSIAALYLVIHALMSAPSSVDETLPVLAPEQSFAELPPRSDPALQKLLDTALDRERRARELARRRKLAVGLVDLAVWEQPRYAHVNGDTMLYAASLPKLALLLAAHHALEAGDLEPSAELSQDLHDMIRVSSNPAATRTLDRLGYVRVAEVLTDRRYRLYDADRGGGLWVGKRFAKEGDRYPDPLHGLVHGATARQVCRFYHLLLAGKLVSPERSREMLDALVEPGILHKFVCALEPRAADRCLYRKSGTWRIWHSDSIVAWSSEGPRYILVALVEDASGEAILQQLGQAIDEALALAPHGATSSARRSIAP